MVDQYFTEILEIFDQSTIPSHVLKCRKILRNYGNLIFNNAFNSIVSYQRRAMFTGELRPKLSFVYQMN